MGQNSSSWILYIEPMQNQVSTYVINQNCSESHETVPCESMRKSKCLTAFTFLLLHSGHPLVQVLVARKPGLTTIKSMKAVQLPLLH